MSIKVLNIDSSGKSENVNLSEKLIRIHPHVFEKDSNTNSKKQIEKN